MSAGLEVKTFQKAIISTKFADIKGMNQCKKEVTEFVDFLKNPTKY